METELTKVRKLKKQSYEDYRSGLLTREEFLSYSEDYSKKEEIYLRQMEKNEKGRDSFGTGSLSDYKKQKYICKQILMELIDRIEVQEDQCLEIYYRFSKPDSRNISAK